MSANGSAVPSEPTEFQDKGKGKSVEEPARTVGLEEDDDEEEEESGVDEVSSPTQNYTLDQTLILSRKLGSRRYMPPFHANYATKRQSSAIAHALCPTRPHQTKYKHADTAFPH